MKSLSSTFIAVGKCGPSARTGSSPAAVLIGSLFAAAVIALPAYAATQHSDVNFEEDFPCAMTIETNGSVSEADELEKAFWVCDHAATTRGVDVTDAITCGKVTEEFKRIKFGGDFEKMVDWWRLNKVAQHAALDRASAATAAGESADTVEYPDSI